MRLPHFEYFEPQTVEEACSILSENRDNSKVIAGGTDLLRLIKNWITRPESLINIKYISGLDSITESADGLDIGPLVTLKEIESSPVIKEKYPLLSEAARSVASPNIRNMGTIGGNLCQDVQCWYFRKSPMVGKPFICKRKGGKVCHAVTGDNRYHAIMGGNGCFAASPSDMATAITAFSATLNIVGPDGKRTIPMEAFYTTMGNKLEPDEIICEIHLPLAGPETKQWFYKMRERNTINFAMSSVASVINLESDIIKDARIVLGGVAPFPFRAVKAEEAVKGQQLNQATADSAAEEAVSGAKPLSMNAHKLAMVKALVKRSILE